MSRLKALREAAGLTQQQVADALGKAQSEIARLERGERRVTLDWAVRLAPLYSVDPAQLLADLAGAAPAPRPAASTTPAVAPPIPILSGARGGDRQTMHLSDGPLGWAARPASLATVRDAYAVYVVGDSMSPRYEPGWLLHVNPIKPPPPGRDVVVRLTDESVLIKSFVGWTADALTLRQLNPAGPLSIPRRQVVSVHLVVGCDQEG